jgi:hypothetical protein
VGTAKLNAAASPRRGNTFRREIIFSATPHLLKAALPQAAYFIQHTFMVRFDSDQVARAQFEGRRGVTVVAAPGVHPAKASRIAANIAKLPELLRRTERAIGGS